MRIPQPKGDRGSLKWIQIIVNDYPEILDREIKTTCNIPVTEDITWVSPLREDDYAEYRDDFFLKKLDYELGHHSLEEFWPARGPQWDALGKSGSGHIFLIEAKAHVDEMLSTGTQASAKSAALINASLDEAKQFLGAKSVVDWTKVFYQYTNRVAHLYLLREVNRLSAYLVFVYFLNDTDKSGPKTADEWRAALKIVKGVLGLRVKHRLSKYVAEVFIDLNEMNELIR